MDAKAPIRKPRGFKIALLIILVLLLLFAAAIYFLPYFLPIDSIRQIAKTKAREMAGLEVDFKSLGFSWNGSVVLDGVVVSPVAKEGVASPGPLLTVDQVRTNVAISPLISGKVVINAVEVNGFSVRLKREADGSLNLPDFNKLAAVSPDGEALGAAKAPNRFRLSALAADAAPQALPPFELHRLDLNKGVISFEDVAQKVQVDVGVETLRVEGATLNDPFQITGKIFPYPEARDKGEIGLNGKVAMVKNGAFDPNGEASMDVDIKAVSLRELAQKLGFGDLLLAGGVNGKLQFGYAKEKVLASTNDFRLAGIALGLGKDQPLNLPDTSASLAAEFDPGPGVVTLADVGLANTLFNLKGKGWVEGINSLAEGGMPVAAVDYAGTANFTDVRQYLAGQKLGLPPLPDVKGTGAFSGKVVLGKQEKPTDPLAPTLTLDFTNGGLAVVDAASGISVDLGLVGVGLRAAASLGQAVEVNAGVSLAKVPVAATVPQLGDKPVSLLLNGGLALNATSAGAAEVEARLTNLLAKVPATPWAAAMDIASPEVKLTYNLARDELNVQSVSFAIGDTVRGGVKSASASGLLGNAPRGSAEMELTAVLAQLKTLFQPLAPKEVASLAGNLRAASRIKLENGTVEAVVQAETSAVSLGVSVPEGTAEVNTPKTTLALTAGTTLANPQVVTIASLAVDAADSTLRLNEASGYTVSGKLGETALRAAGRVDAGAMLAEFSNFGVHSGGVLLDIGQGGQHVAGLSGGVAQLIVAAPGQTAILPLSGQGDFNLPALDIGADKLIFYRLADGKREDSDFGSLRAKVSVDGYIGGEKRQLINLRTASLTAKPVALNSRGQFDLGTQALLFEYAARLAPEGMTPLLEFLNLPPAMLANASVSGVVSYDGAQISTKGSTQGELRLASGEINPFELSHDFSASYQEADKSLAVTVRRLDGTVKTAAGEAVTTLVAQPSDLLLSRAGSKGLLDIRLDGAAAPTRLLAVGLAGVMPQLREYSNLLYEAKVEGIYNAWLQVQDKDPTTVAVNMGGVWQGAALHFGNAPFLADAGKLSGALEGDFSFKENRIRLSKLFFRSDSGQIQADGVANAVLATDPAGDIAGLANVDVDLRFVMADLSKAALAFPGVIPGDMGLAGRVDGAFKAGGDAADIKVREGAVRFQGFQAKPSGTELAIPSGTATFGAGISLTTNAPSGPPSDYDALKLFNLTNGQASLTGAQLRGRPINALTADFQLQNGLLTLKSARVEMQDGGGVAADGTVDFNQPAPAANMRLALKNVPLAEVNSETADFMQFQSGVINLPATQGQTAVVAFQGFSEDEILRTLRLENFTFATGPVTMHTGSALNAELDKAKGLMKQQVHETGQVRVITLTSVSGVAQAAGNGIIVIPSENPINVIGDNTADLRVQGTVSANHTMNLDFFVVGKLENLIGFSLPNIIPNLRTDTDEQKSRFMNKMNQNAATGHYKVNISGPLEQPNLSGIGELAGRFIIDIVAAAPTQIIGGVLDLAKDSPGALLDAPKNITKSLGSVLGLNQGEATTAPSQTPTQPQQEQRGLRLPQLFR